jgi:hypothetical protein
MGPLIIVPITGLVLLQVVLAGALLLPKRMAGSRSTASRLYAGVLAVTWLWQLGRTVDSFQDFYLSLVVSLVTFIGLFVHYRRQA